MLTVPVLNIILALSAYMIVDSLYERRAPVYAFATVSNIADIRDDNRAWTVFDLWKVNQVEDKQSQILHVNYSFISNTTDTIDANAGHVDAINHIAKLPCKIGDSMNITTCLLFDSIAPHSTIIGVEYVITKTAYESLPEKEKSYWHNHTQETKLEGENLVALNITAQQGQETIKNLNGTYGRIFLTWDPAKEFPSAFPHSPLEDHPFTYGNMTNEQTS